MIDIPGAIMLEIKVRKAILILCMYLEKSKNIGIFNRILNGESDTKNGITREGTRNLRNEF